MAWAKVDDQWFAHRKVVGLSLGARGLWATVLSWSCAHRTPDVPEHMPRFLAGGKDVTALVVELVAAGLWHEVEGGWRIHDWGEYQEKSLSEKRAESGRKGGKASGQSRAVEANPKQTEVASEANAEAGTRPGPTQPNPPQPNPKSTSSSSRKRADRATRLPDDWHPAPEPDLVEQVGGQDAARREFERFRDYWRARGGQAARKRDWQATWRNWLRRAADDRQRANGARASPRPSKSAAYAEAWEAKAAELEAAERSQP